MRLLLLLLAILPANVMAGTIYRDQVPVEFRVISGDRNAFGFAQVTIDEALEWEMSFDSTGWLTTPTGMMRPFGRIHGAPYIDGQGQRQVTVDAGWEAWHDGNYLLFPQTEYVSGPWYEEVLQDTLDWVDWRFAPGQFGGRRMSLGTTDLGQDVSWWHFWDWGGSESFRIPAIPEPSAWLLVLIGLLLLSGCRDSKPAAGQVTGEASASAEADLDQMRAARERAKQQWEERQFPAE